MAKVAPSREDVVFVDPDPFTVTATVLAGAGVILQFVQVLHGFRTNAPGVPASTPALRRLQPAIEDLKLKLATVERAINRGSASPDREFYEQKFRISVGILNLERAHHREFTSALPDLMAAVGALSRWANSLIENDAAAAAYLGAEVMTTAGDAADELNQMMADGATNREILAVARIIFDALERALARALDRRDN